MSFMTIDEIISKLQCVDFEIPEEALRMAIQEKDLITPRLLHEIEVVKNNIKDYLYAPDFSLHFLAMHLLAQFRETKAFSLIVDFFSIPGNNAICATGSLVYYDLSRILASTYDGDFNKLKVMIENENLNEYTRSAAINAMIILWGNEMLPRKEVVEYIRSLLVGKLKDDSSFAFATLLTSIPFLSIDELKDDVENIFLKKGISDYYSKRPETHKYFGLTNEEAIENFKKITHFHLITDVIEELQKWTSFNLDDLDSDLGDEYDYDLDDDEEDFLIDKNEKEEDLFALTPFLQKEKTGRNDPCSCGSGKKYKKCCFKN